MAQEFTVTISDALWADVQTNLSKDIDHSLTGSQTISVERMTEYLDDLIIYRLQLTVNNQKVKVFKDSL